MDVKIRPVGNSVGSKTNRTERDERSESRDSSSGRTRCVAHLGPLSNGSVLEGRERKGGGKRSYQHPVSISCQAGERRIARVSGRREGKSARAFIRAYGNARERGVARVFPAKNTGGTLPRGSLAPSAIAQPA